MQGRRAVIIPLPPSWLTTSLLLTGVFVLLAWADRSYWNYVLADPAELRAVSERVDSLESFRVVPDATDTQARGQLTSFQSELDRMAQLAALGFSMNLAQRRSLGSDAAQALYERCLEWARNGGEFSTACQ